MLLISGVISLIMIKASDSKYWCSLYSVFIIVYPSSGPIIVISHTHRSMNTHQQYSFFQSPLTCAPVLLPPTLCSVLPSLKYWLLHRWAERLSITTQTEKKDIYPWHRVMSWGFVSLAQPVKWPIYTAYIKEMEGSNWTLVRECK